MELLSSKQKPLRSRTDAIKALWDIRSLSPDRRDNQIHQPSLWFNVQGMGTPWQRMVLMTLHSQRKSNSTQWKKLRLRILQRDGYQCFWCGEDANTCDHVIPVARGGSDDPDNLVAACKRCNFSRQDRLPEEMNLVRQKKAGIFLDRDSTATLSRGLLSPPNDSKSHE